MNAKDLAIAYAAARVSFQHVLYVSKRISIQELNQSLDKALNEIISIETILQRYMDELKENHDIPDKGDP